VEISDRAVIACTAVPSGACKWSINPVSSQRRLKRDVIGKFIVQ
jgi:hypothetical protein